MLRSANPRLQPVLDRVAAKKEKSRILISIDGPCGSGKTTLAQELADMLSAPVIHMDDFSIPHAQKTPERLRIPGGNADVERFLREVLHPILRTGRASYRPYLCHSDAYGESIPIPESRCYIIEGSYSMMPEIAEHVDVHVFLRITPEEQQKRILNRGGEEKLAQFNKRWIPLENAYFAAYHLPDARCICIPGDYVQAL
ncbi:MAG: AAA family ATPase [Clostridia bacterium]|nr:AAA family ATPase [Clostridia bacterium]